MMDNKLKNMRDKIIAPVFLVCCILCIAAGCSSRKDISGNYIFKTECLGSELDGSVTLKAWGNGRNRADAIEQAKKNAVNDVIFRGIIEGKEDCFPRPLVSEVNARLKYESYFNAFFRDKGEYRHYVLTEESFGDRFKRTPKISRHGSTYGVVVRILRPELKEKLISDGIIKR